MFTGREWIKELKLYDYRNRMYQPELGRFLQPDPIQFGAGDYNLYRYCHNDPVNKTDPLGLEPISVKNDVDEKSREGLVKVREIARNYHHYDARGHCILLTSPSSGTIVEQYDYDAFGRPYFYDRWGNDIGTSLWENRFLFTGREWIKKLKLYDYRHRMYQPELGRFLQPDPKHFGAGDYNLYRYCHNDPVNKTDPMGLKPPEEGLVDLPKDTLQGMFHAGKLNNADTNKRANNDKQGRKVEFRRDGFKKDGKTEDGVSKGYWANGRPEAGPPKNPNGGTRVYTTHSHVTGSNQHLDHDKAVANGYQVPSGVTYSGGGPMQIYVPKDGGGGGKTYYTNDGATLTTDRAGNKSIDW